MIGLTLSPNSLWESDRFSLMAVAHSESDEISLNLRKYQTGTVWYCSLGVHQLAITQEGSALQLRRWSNITGPSELWAELYFTSWERG